MDTLEEVQCRSYIDMTTRIKVGNEFSKKIHVTKGLKQKCYIASGLFKTYIEGEHLKNGGKMF